MKKLYTIASLLILFAAGLASRVEAACNMTVSISPSTVTINVGGSTGNLTATAINNVGSVTYSWSPCSTLNASTGASVISTPAGTTTYTVTAFDASGCSATATTTVNVVDPSIPGSGGASTVNAAYTYSFSNGGGVFSSMAGATVLATNSGMTNTNYNIDLSGLSPAFNFTFPGGTFNQFGVNTNGYVFLGAAATATTNQPIASTDACTGIISGWGVALQGRAGTGGSGSNIEYVVSGASPNRILIIQWTGAQFQSRGGSASQFFNMQIKLYEATGVVDFIYSDQFSQFISGQIGNVQIGLRGATNADFVNRTGGGGGGFGWSPSLTSAGVNNTDGVTFIGGTFASYIAGPDRITYTPSCIGTRTTITPSGTMNLCPGGSVDLTASAGTSYQWYVNGVLDANTAQTFSGITTAGTYAVLAAPSVGCGIPSYVYAVTMNANVVSSVTIAANPTTLCSNGVFTATPMNGGCTPTYQWLLNGSPVSNVALNSAIYTNNALNPNDQVQVVMKTNALCASPASDSSNILSTSLPVIAPVAGGALTICLNGTTPAFTDVTAGGSWSITPGTGTANITTGGIVNGLTSGTVFVVYSYSNGTCTNTATKLLTVNALPVVASITGTQSVCLSSTTQLSDATAGGTWLSGNTSVATIDGSGLTTSIAAGSSLITYTTAADVNGCINSTTATVTVNPLPAVASITGAISACTNASTQLSDATSGGTWGSGTSTVATVDGSGLVTAMAAGTSQITYTTAPDGNGCTASVSVTVTVNQSPTAGASSNSPLCSGEGLTLSSSGGANYSWAGPNAFTSSQQNETISNVAVTDSGTYIITVTDANGCTATTSTAVTVNQSPVAQNVSSNSPVCSGNTLTLTSDGGTGYSWTGPDSFASAQQNPSASNVAVVDSGTYIVTITGANGCTITSTVAVIVNPSPLSSASSNSPVCLGSGLTLSSGGGTGFSWTGPNGFTSAQQNPGVLNSAFADSGIYTVTVTGANGCTGTISTSVIVNPLPVAGASGNSPLCSGNPLFLSSSGGTDYTWQGPNGFTSGQQNPFITNAVSADSGTFTVTVTDGNGCTAMASYPVIVFPPIPTPGITQVGHTLICSYDPSYTSFQWYADTALIPGATHDSLFVTLDGNYNVQVGDANGCKVAVGINVTFTGIPTLAAQGTDDYLTSLSPNPATSQLMIHTSFPNTINVVTISVMNVLGEIASPLLTLQKSSADAIIDIGNLPAGVYFLQVRSGDYFSTKRFVKE